MEFELDRVERLRSMGLDERAQAALRQALPIIEQNIDHAIEAGLRLNQSLPGCSKFYANLDMEAAKRVHRKHWIEEMLAGAISDDVLRHGVEIYETRERAGLDCRYFFTFFNTFLNTLIEDIAPFYRKKPQELVQVVTALNKAFLLELEMSASVFIASGKTFTQKTVKTYADEFERDVLQVVNAVATAADQMSAAATTASSSADQTNRQTAEVITITADTTDNARSVVNAAGELSASVREIGVQVAQSSDMSRLATQEAEKANSTVRGLADSSAKIGDVVKLISDIASQTNLLALNATIEAARAGEAGKGFAVVAGEVKNLANQTARATSEIAEQVSGIQRSAQASVAAMKSVGAAIEQVNSVIGSIAAAVEEQNAATADIARNAAEAAAGTRMVEGNIAEVSAAAATTTGMAEQMEAVAGLLEQDGKGLARHVETFLGTMKAV